MTDPYVTAIEATHLFVDGSYQRQPNLRRVEKMAAGWDVRLVGILEVSDRGEGARPRFAVVGGQHRLLAAVKALGVSTPLVCRVHSDLNPATEAELMLALEREQKPLTAWDKWRARRASGDRVVLQIESAVESAGLHVQIGRDPRYIACTGALERLYELSGTTLIRDTLDLIVDVWPRSGEALRAQMVSALGLVLDSYDGDLDTGRLADAMSEMTPTQALARARELKGADKRLTGTTAVASVLVSAYNAQPGRAVRLAPLLEQLALIAGVAL